MAVNRIILYFLFAIGMFTTAHAQKHAGLIQFSGVVMTSDSLRPIPYVNIIIKNTHRGTISSYQGFFSFVSLAGDTIIFSALGYKRKIYVIPDTLNESKYSIFQLMTKDTIHLPETVVYPWPTRDQFREAFLKLDIPDDDLERARKNLEREVLKELGEYMPMDANQNIDLYLRQEAAKLYTSGQYPYMGILDPSAWISFIEAWKRGDFKRK